MRLRRAPWRGPVGIMSDCCTPSPAAGSCCGHSNQKSAGPTAGDLTWFRVAIALVLAGQGMVFGLGYNNALRAGHAPAYGSTVYWMLHGALMASALAVMALLGPALVRGSWAALRSRRIAVDQLFLLTMSGAFIGSVVSTISGKGSVYYEIVGVVLAIYTVGRKVGARTRDRALAEADALREDFAEVFQIDADGNRRRVSVSLIHPGDDRVSVFPGEPVPVDGVIVEGVGEVRETAVSGELVPEMRRAGDRLFAGSYAIGGPFRIRVTAGAGARMLDRILETVEDATRRPSRVQIEADRLMRYFLPVVIGVSMCTFVGWLVAPGVAWWEALFNAMAVLLVACPCALGLATPIAVWSGLLALSKRGLVSRSGALLDALTGADLWIFDKTGTLSEEDLAVGDVTWLDEPMDVDWLRAAVATLEEGLDHPVARALADWESERVPVTRREAVPGASVTGEAGGHAIAIGRRDWLESAYGVDFSSGAEGKTQVGIVVDGRAVGLIALTECLRPSSAAALESLSRNGAEVRILTGDPHPSWEAISGVAIERGVDPESKRARVRAAMDEGRIVIFVGDGVNDAAAMAEASAGIAMGGASALTKATAEAALLGGDLGVLPWARDLCRNVVSRLRGNLRFAIAYNTIGMSLAAAGILHPVVAALLMLGSSAWVSWRAANPVETARSGGRPEASQTVKVAPSV